MQTGSAPVPTADGLPSDARFAIVVARFNESITSKLLAGAINAFAAVGISEDRVRTAWVPGAWELPLVAKRFAHSGQFAAVLCLGAVIKGETTHDQYINRQVSDSLGRISLETDVPVLFGVLTCDTLQQAIDRAGGAHSDKGAECAAAAIEMVKLLSTL